MAHDTGVRWPGWGCLHLKSYFCFHEGEEARGLELLAQVRRFCRSYGYVFGAGLDLTLDGEGWDGGDKWKRCDQNSELSHINSSLFSSSPRLCTSSLL